MHRGVPSGTTPPLRPDHGPPPPGPRSLPRPPNLRSPSTLIPIAITIAMSTARALTARC